MVINIKVRISRKLQGDNSVSMNNRKTGIHYAARLRNFASYFSKTYNFTIDDT